MGNRAFAIALCAAALLTLGPAAAAFADTPQGGGATLSQAAEVVLKRGDRGPAVARVQGRLSLVADGVFGPMTERAVSRFQRRRGLTADGVVGPLTRRALGLPPFARREVRRKTRSSQRPSGPLPRVLVRIALCESGGNPRAVSRDGRYRGKYQFTLATWRALGGRGDPADAPEWLQDRLALKLYRRSGTAPWPSCG
jgi:peptidoglycan hydrolase-like protein with peptidoglycan-binding domain